MLNSKDEDEEEEREHATRGRMCRMGCLRDTKVEDMERSEEETW